MKSFKYAVEAPPAPNFSVVINADISQLDHMQALLMHLYLMKLLLSFKEKSNTTNETLFSSPKTRPSKGSVKHRSYDAL